MSTRLEVVNVKVAVIAGVEALSFARGLMPLVVG